jgi:hypothetical protein
MEAWKRNGHRRQPAIVSFEANGRLDARRRLEVGFDRMRVFDAVDQ